MTNTPKKNPINKVSPKKPIINVAKTKIVPVKSEISNGQNSLTPVPVSTSAILTKNSSRENLELKNQINELRNQINELRNQINELKKQNEELKKQNEELQKQLLELEKQNLDLLNQKSIYQKALAKLQEDLKNIKMSIEKLQREKNDLLNNIKKLQDLNISLKGLINSFTSYISELNKVINIKQKECTGF